MEGRLIKKLKVSNICAVRFCKTTSQTEGASLFRFPKDVKRCKHWLKLSGSEYLLRPVICSNNSIYRVCHLHFEQRMFKKVNSGRKLLVADAVPTLDLPETEKLNIAQTVTADNHSDNTVHGKVFHSSERQDLLECQPYPSGLQPPASSSEIKFTSSFITKSDVEVKKEIVIL